MEDAEIIRQVLAGHPEKFAGLVERYQAPLIHLTLCVNREEKYR